MSPAVLCPRPFRFATSPLVGVGGHGDSTSQRCKQPSRNLAARGALSLVRAEAEILPARVHGAVAIAPRSLLRVSRIFRQSLNDCARSARDFVLSNACRRSSVKLLGFYLFWISFLARSCS